MKEYLNEIRSFINTHIILM